MSSAMGERGPHGDHGQAGHDGLPGERGPQGDHGQTGQTGLRGPVGISRQQVLALFLFLTLALSLLAYRTEVNTDHIRETDDATCRYSNENARNLNYALGALIQAVRESPTITPADRRNRVALFKAAMVDPLPC